MLRCAITPGKLALKCDAERRSSASSKLTARCGELADDGVNFLLVREKRLAAADLTSLVRGIVQTVDGSGARVLVAQRLDVALVAGAGGVHLSSAVGELTPAQVRKLMPQAWMSISCHTLDEVHRAVAGGTDAILFAPVFGKFADGIRVADGAGLEFLQEAAAAAGTIPVFALGSVTMEDVEACRVSGASGIAGIRLFFP